MFELKKFGYTQHDIAKKFGISRSTVRYHLDRHFKELIKKNSAERKKLPEEKERAKKRMVERYHKDKEFREKQKKRSNEYGKRNKVKRRILNKRYWEKNKESITERRLKKKKFKRKKYLIYLAIKFAFMIICIMLLSYLMLAAV